MTNRKFINFLKQLLYAMIFTGVAVVIRLVFFSDIDRGIPYLTFYPTIAIVAIYGTLTSGILVAIFSFFLTYFWIQQGTLSHIELLAEGIFVISCIIISFAGAMKNRAVQKELAASNKLKSVSDEILEKNKKLEYFASIINLADDAIIGKDLDGNITSWNKGAEKIYGYSSNEIIGKNIEMLVVPGKENEIKEILKQIKQGKSIENYETVRKTKNGNRIDVFLSVSPIKDSVGNIIGASTIAHDITEKKLQEKMIKSETEDLEKLNKMMMDRELKMVELKKENEELKIKLENK